MGPGPLFLVSLRLVSFLRDVSNPFFHIFVCVWKLYYLKTLGPSLTPQVPAASCSEGCSPVCFIILLCHFIVTEAPTVGIPQGWMRELLPQEPWHCGHLGCFPPWVLGTSCASQGQRPPCSPPKAVSHQRKQWPQPRQTPRVSG